MKSVKIYLLCVHTIETRFEDFLLKQTHTSDVFQNNKFPPERKTINKKQSAKQRFDDGSHSSYCFIHIKLTTAAKKRPSLSFNDNYSRRRTFRN